jgi:hypothetical protein
MSTAALTKSTLLPTSSATYLYRLQTQNMTPSSTGDSPRSATGGPVGRHPQQQHFSMPTRDTFAIDVPSPQLAAINGAALKSPTSLKTQRTPSFSREGILGSAQKARNLSQSSENRPDTIITNGVHKAPSIDDDSSNPLKRRNTDAGVDYPRRRATIAVRIPPRSSVLTWERADELQGLLTAFALSVRGVPVAKI